MYMDSNSNKEDAKDRGEDDRVHENRESARPHVHKVYPPLAPGQLE